MSHMPPVALPVTDRASSTLAELRPSRAPALIWGAASAPVFMLLAIGFHLALGGVWLAATVANGWLALTSMLYRS